MQIPSKLDFGLMLQAQFDNRQFVCLGLDPVYERIPLSVHGRFLGEAELLEEALAYYNFCVEVVNYTHDQVAAYKPNTAFFESAGAHGYEMLRLLIRHIRRVAPLVPVIVDAKRGDIGKTNVGSVRMIFDYLGADAVTVNPYFGAEALQPFLERQGRGVVILCRTSNPGAKEFQSLEVASPDGGTVPLYQEVARAIQGWESAAVKAVVIGATDIKAMQGVRQVLPDTLALLPGVGIQGGQLEPAVYYGRNSESSGFLINAGSSELYASDGPDFAMLTRSRITELNRLIRETLDATPTT